MLFIYGSKCDGYAASSSGFGANPMGPFVARFTLQYNGGSAMQHDRCHLIPLFKIHSIVAPQTNANYLRSKQFLVVGVRGNTLVVCVFVDNDLVWFVTNKVKVLQSRYEHLYFLGDGWGISTEGARRIYITGSVLLHPSLPDCSGPGLTINKVQKRLLFVIGYKMLYVYHPRHQQTRRCLLDALSQIVHVGPSTFGTIHDGNGAGFYEGCISHNMGVVLLMRLVLNV
jgi:hypothetical protein